MQAIDVSDLEEGEILEYEICSTGGSLDGEPILQNKRHILKKCHREESCKKTQVKKTWLKDNVIISSSYRNEGYLNKSLKERLKLADKVIHRKKISMYNESKYKLEGNLSDSEYSSEEYEKTILNENRYLGTCNNGQPEKERLKKKRNDQILHGTAEDIMSQIGKTICRKSHCNYKRRKLRNLKGNLENRSRFNGVRRKEDSSSHMTSNKKRKHVKQKISHSDSDSDGHRKYFRDDFCRRKRSGRRKKEVKDNYNSKDGIIEKANKDTSLRKSSVKKLRDFDEVRKCLLEKLKQKAEEEEEEEEKEVHEIPQNTDSELMASENQGNEIENKPKKPLCSLSVEETLDRTFNKENTVTETDSQRNSKQENLESEEDELDLKKLRLIALASNRKRKIERSTSSSTSEAGNSLSGVDKCDTADKQPAGNNLCDRDDNDTDFDRNELLLRAEALKTALLKKHQKRLNKLKSNKLKLVVSPSDNNSSGENIKTPVTISPEPQNNENFINHEINEVESVVLFNSRVNVDTFKEDFEKENGDEISTTCNDIAKIQENKNEITSVSGTKSNKRHLKTVKKKIRKISALPSSVKENDKANEVVEEDDRILRSQLLCDLIKKKSLKELEKKPILTDSMQTSINLSTPLNHKSKSNLKSTPTVKSNVLKKINTSKATKVETLSKIPKPEIQRIIVHLGSDESSEDESVSATSATPQTVLRENGNEEGMITSGNFDVVGKQNDQSIQASYERSVELLLSEARKKVEGEMQKANNIAPTPEAVYKHLPPSQRLEYIRLKQKIAERERQKKLNGFPNGTSRSLKNSGKDSTEGVLGEPVPSAAGNVTNAEVGSTQTNTNVSFVSDCNLNTSKINPVQSSGLNSENGQNSSRNFQSGVKNIFSTSKYTRINKTVGGERTQKTFVVNKLKNKNEIARSSEKLNSKILTRKYVASSSSAGSKSTNNHLISSNQVLISKLKLFLRKIKIEKTIEENYDKEIAKLKNQLSLVSKKRLEQRFKIKKLAEESNKIYRAIKNITDSTGKAKPRAEESKGREKSGKTDCTVSLCNENERKIEKIEQRTEEIDNCQRTKLENDSKDEISKDFSVGSGCGSGKEFSEDNSTSEVVSSEASLGACDLSRYTSPLEVFAKASNNTGRVDPNVIMCQFDLMGICKDEECKYQHFRTT